MDAIQTGWNNSQHAGERSPKKAQSTISTHSSLPVFPGLLLATTGLLVPVSVMAEEPRCESQSSIQCTEQKRLNQTLPAAWTPVDANSSVTINENTQVVLSAEHNTEETWRNFRSLTVGNQTDGELTIDGRTIQTSGGTIGRAAKGVVSLINGAKWHIVSNSLTDGKIFLGTDNGDGMLIVKDGSQIDGLKEIRIGEFYSGAKGLAVIKGKDSSIATAWAVVGDQGEGRLDILNGGELTSTGWMNIGYVGVTASSNRKGNGIVNISGQESSLNVASVLYLGGFENKPNDAKGTLTVSDGGTVTAGKYIWAGLSKGSTAVINIGGKPGEAAQAAGYIKTPMIYLGDQTIGGSTAILNFNHTTDNYLLNAKISGAGEVNHNGPGTTLVEGDNKYWGTTTVNRGIFRAASTTGFSSNSDFHVAESATLDLNGYSQTIHSLSLDGTLTFGEPGASRDNLSLANSMLTVKGHYTGNNGLLILNTTQDEALDQPVVNKVEVQGDTSGTTRVMLKALGKAAVGDLDGARVVQVNGVSDGEFIAAGRLVAGAYDYALIRGNDTESGETIPDTNHWYLSNIWVPDDEPDIKDDTDPLDDPLPEPEPKENDTSEPQAPPSPGANPSSEAVLRPEMGAYLANRLAANTLFVTRLHDRLGETQYIDPISGEIKVTSMWLRNVGGHNRFHDSSGQLKTQSNRYVIQMGGDIAQWSSDNQDRWHLGMMAGYANSQSNTRSGVSHYRADGTVSGYSAGWYATWYADNAKKEGTWLDVWMLYNWFDSSVRGENLAEERYRAKGITASLEVGHSFKLGEQPRLSYWLQPQAQLTWMGVSADNHREENGTLVRDKDKGNLQSRVGVKGYLQGHSAQDEGKERLFQPYIETNWLHNTRDFSVSMNEETGRIKGAKNVGEFRAGVEAKMNSRLHLWGNVGQQLGNDGYSDTQAMLGLKLVF